MILKIETVGTARVKDNALDITVKVSKQRRHLLYLEDRKDEPTIIKEDKNALKSLDKEVETGVNAIKSAIKEQYSGSIEILSDRTTKSRGSKDKEELYNSEYYIRRVAMKVKIDTSNLNEEGLLMMIDMISESVKIAEKEADVYINTCLSESTALKARNEAVEDAIDLAYSEAKIIFDRVVKNEGISSAGGNIKLVSMTRHTPANTVMEYSCKQSYSADSLINTVREGTTIHTRDIKESVATEWEFNLG